MRRPIDKLVFSLAKERRLAMEEDSKICLVIGPADIADLASVSQLLSRSNLPIADFEAHIDSMLLAKSRATLVGVVALEHYGETALLRSLCVREVHRSAGVGQL